MLDRKPLCGAPLAVFPHNGPAIHRLPDNILVHIFVLLIEGWVWRKYPWAPKYEVRTRPPRRHDGYWTPLMLVCRRWREVGRTSAHLWQTVDVNSSPEGLRLALERSQGAALELSFHHDSIVLSSISLLTRQAYRLRKLLLPPMEGSDLPALRALLSTDMPVLNELRFWVDEYQGAPRADPTSIRFRAAHFPRMRFLRLSHITFSWEPNAVSNLRFLHLHKCQSPDPPLPFGTFLDVLATCAELEELRLHMFISTIAHWRSDNSGSKRDISLPRLRKLVVGDVPSLVALLLSSITLPSNITLRLVGYIDSEIWSNTYATNLFSSLLPKDRARLPGFQSVTQVDFQGYEDIYLRGISPTSSIALKLRSKLDLQASYTENALMEAADIFRHAPVTDVDINCEQDSVDDVEVWEYLFAAFPGMRSLTVQPAQVVRPIWNALGGRSYPWTEAVKGSLCPELRELEMDYLPWDQEAMDYILASLRRRHLRGLPKLDFLSLTFRDTSRVVREMDLMIPSYQEHITTYVEEFEWSRA